jgi:hypothetical protein
VHCSEFDKDRIDPAVMRKVQKYTALPECQTEAIRKVRPCAECATIQVMLKGNFASKAHAFRAYWWAWGSCYNNPVIVQAPRLVGHQRVTQAAS